MTDKLVECLKAGAIRFEEGFVGRGRGSGSLPHSGSGSDFAGVPAEMEPKQVIAAGVFFFCFFEREKKSEG